MAPKTEIPIPEGWRPIGLGLNLDGQAFTIGGPRWEEAVRTAIQMRNDPDIPTPRTQPRLWDYMLRNREDNPNCCPADVSPKLSSELI